MFPTSNVAAVAIRPILAAAIYLLACGRGAAAQPFDLNCSYAEGNQITPHLHCAKAAKDSPEFDPQHLRRMAYSVQGLAAVAVGSQWYYVRRTGRSLAVLSWDNGPDPYAEGLVRSRVGGRVGYFDAEFHLVIPPRYDWGSPFRNGRALVCIGCRESTPDEDGHRSLQGGQWGAIDREGREISPIKFGSPDDIR